MRETWYSSNVSSGSFGFEDSEDEGVDEGSADSGFVGLLAWLMDGGDNSDFFLRARFASEDELESTSDMGVSIGVAVMASRRCGVEVLKGKALIVGYLPVVNGLRNGSMEYRSAILNNLMVD